MDYKKNDVLCTVFCYARSSKTREAFTGFGMRKSLLLANLGWQYFNSLDVENDNPIFT